MHSATTVTVLVISLRTAQRKLTHQEHLVTLIDCTPTHATMTSAGTDHNISIMHAAKETALTCQDHTINLNTAETPATVRDMHPDLYPMTTAAHNTHPQTDTLGDTPARTPHTITSTTYP